MTQVNFYILPQHDSNSREAFIYLLVNKALTQAGRILIIAADATQSKRLSQQLWCNQPERFIAHEIIQQADDIQPPYPAVWLMSGFDQAIYTRLASNSEVIIDLSHDGVTLASKKILLVTNQDPEILANSRMKYQAYVDSGITPAVHKIGQTSD
ncbi:DNA polymerase III subunit chi [Ostreibacterium oceani]|uniref:DNA polymerase III subunit chi n=1 Tax=Ostreibacterium oceani TaxID=2654998 RepID=A0A6N7F3K6_9GAMM|nr:DNA polymerase III subunit chi [Ostreibacterium oceani]MPV86456.1 hypothetical protein [Ostreibacterium oceani]